ncbi:MAG: hypothetical protein R2851_03480 [Caldilineaceae bacterium]
MVLDTGIDNNHLFVAGNLVDEACFSTSVPGLTTSPAPTAARASLVPVRADALTPASSTGSCAAPTAPMWRARRGRSHRVGHIQRRRPAPILRHPDLTRVDANI